MRKFAVILLLGALALIIPGTVLRTLAPDIITPNFIVALLVFVAFYENNPLGALSAFCLGLEMDICSGVLLGPWAASFIVVFSLLVACSRRIFIQSGLVVFLSVGLATVLSTLLFYLMLLFVYGRFSFGSDAIGTLLIEAALSAVLGPMLFSGFKRVVPGHLVERGVRGVQVLEA